MHMYIYAYISMCLDYAQAHAAATCLPLATCTTLFLALAPMNFFWIGPGTQS